MYTTGCSRCEILKRKLMEKRVEFREFTDMKKMIDMGLSQVPMLEVDGVLLDFTSALTWLNSL